MIKFSLCIEPLFPELAFSDRIALAADLGFDAIEFWDPAGKDLAQIARLASRHKLAVAACCLQDAWKVRANAPASLVLESVRKSIDIAQELGCTALIALSGDKDVTGRGQVQVIIDNLKRVADLLEESGVTLVLETLNSRRDHPGYFLDNSADGFDIVRSVSSNHVRLLYDIYHMQIMEGNLTETIEANLPFIGHFHSAGVPGRHEHSSGEIHYPHLLKTIDNRGYGGFFGLEYWPTYDQRSSVRDMLAYLKTYI